MSQSEEMKQGTPAEVGKGSVRKPYVKPEFRHEKVFETMALSCGKMQSSSGGCHGVKKSS